MNIKDGFRYQNFLTNTIEWASKLLLYGDGSVAANFDTTCIVTEKHMRSKVDPEAQDEVIFKSPSDNGYPGNDKVIQFIGTLLEEKVDIATAIHKAKSEAHINIDAAVDVNRAREGAIRWLASLLSKKIPVAPKIENNGTGFRFNVNGDQVSYSYPIQYEYQPAYDVEEAKALLKKWKRERDESSAEIEWVLVNTTLDFEPKFDVNDAPRDALFAFMDA